MKNHFTGGKTIPTGSRKERKGKVKGGRVYSHSKNKHRDSVDRCRRGHQNASGGRERIP